MESIRAKLGAWSKDRALMRTFAVLATVLLILIILSCISIHMRSNIQNRYSNALYQIQEETYRHLIALTESFTQLQAAAPEEQMSIFPEFKAQYTAVDALNSALVSGYGERHAVLEEALATSMRNAYDEYVSAISQNRATGLARADIAECMKIFEAKIEKRYAYLEEEPVPVIDGSSGEIRENT